jgi:hypothetical protein
MTFSSSASALPLHNSRFRLLSHSLPPSRAASHLANVFNWLPLMKIIFNNLCETLFWCVSFHFLSLSSIHRHPFIHYSFICVSAKKEVTSEGEIEINILCVCVCVCSNNAMRKRGERIDSFAGIPFFLH